MNSRRAVFGSVGLVLLAAVVGASGAVAPLVPLSAVLGVVGNDYFLVVALSSIALIGMVTSSVHGRGVRECDMPNPEETVTVPAPGDHLRTSLDTWHIALPIVGRDARRSIKSRLRDDATQVIQQANNCTADEARKRVESGVWTENRTAAAFLSTTRTIPITTTLRALPNRESWFAYGARRSAEAIVAKDLTGAGSTSSPIEDRRRTG